MQTSGLNFSDNAQLKKKLGNNELEISVFGRGYGECIVIGCKGDDYIVVDSFLNPETQNPIALDYLRSMGVPSTAIKTVLLTHWHTDHISGVERILSSCNADLMLSPVLSASVFQEVIGREMKRKRPSTTEYTKVLNFIKENKKKICFVAKDKNIYYGDDGDIQIFSLTPSDMEFCEYLEFLTSKYKENDLISYDFLDDNMLSIVLLIKQLKKGVLLGSDLESGSSEHGWVELVNNYRYKDVKPSVFKIPHHGSENGHNDLLWKNVLQDKPTSVLTVFNKSTGLPKTKDIERIVGLSNRLFVVGERPKKDKDLLRQIRKTQLSEVSIITLPQKVGLLRYRCSIDNGEERFEGFGAVEEYSK